MLPKKVALIGAGLSNRSLLSHLLDCGLSVTVRDRKDKDTVMQKIPPDLRNRVAYRCGESYLCDLDEDILFRAPGIRPDISAFQEALARGAILTSDIAYFFEHCPAPIYGVTGSDGKTTTSTLLSRLLGFLRHTHLGGNIGTPLCDFLGKVAPTDAVVAELSSFQLMTLCRAPRVAVVTNLSPNHLDYHTDFEEYRASKERIFTQEGCECAVLNYDNLQTRDMASRLPSHVECRFFGFGEGTHLYVNCHDGKLFRRGTFLCRCDDLCVSGKHNIENFMAALCAAGDDITAQMAQSVAKNFHGVAHRLEWVATKNGVRYINSSIDSTPTRTKAALEALSADAHRILLILGGYDKHLDFSPLCAPIVAAAKGVVLQGATASKIAFALQNDPDFCASAIPLFFAKDLEDAVLICKENAQSGDVVLLSPACASFDAFEHFEARGSAFRKAVHAL